MGGGGDEPCRAAAADVGVVHCGRRSPLTACRARTPTHPVHLPPPNDAETCTIPNCATCKTVTLFGRRRLQSGFSVSIPTVTVPTFKIPTISIPKFTTVYCSVCNTGYLSFGAGCSA